MLFFIFSNAEILFAEQKLIKKLYTLIKTLPAIKQIQIVMS